MSPQKARTDGSFFKIQAINGRDEGIRRETGYSKVGLGDVKGY
jgi:hypothetical protein